MTLKERIAMARRLEETCRAERMGLIQAKIGVPLSREHFKEEHIWEGFSRGYAEGRSILEIGEGA